MASNEALERLQKLMGAEKARALYEEVLGRAGLSSVSTPEQLYRFATALAEDGGVYATIASSLQTKAKLMDARASLRRAKLIEKPDSGD